MIRLRTGPVLGFGPAGFLLTRTSTGPFFGPASLTYSRNKFQIRVRRRQARVMPPLVRHGCESCVMKQHCYATFEVCRRQARMTRGSRAPVPRISGFCLHARSLSSVDMSSNPNPAQCSNLLYLSVFIRNHQHAK